MYIQPVTRPFAVRLVLRQSRRFLRRMKRKIQGTFIRLERKCSSNRLRIRVHNIPRGALTSKENVCRSFAPYNSRIVPRRDFELLCVRSAGKGTRGSDDKYPAGENTTVRDRGQAAGTKQYCQRRGRAARRTR